MIHSGKNVVVLGLGGSGEAAAHLLREEGAVVTVCDSGTKPAVQERASKLRESGIAVKLGTEADADPASYDLCVLSPGIDPAVPLVRNVIAKGIPIIGEIELAYEECSCPVVAITGTNGKTTTTELTETILRGAGLRVAACGNIGLPFSSAVRGSDALDVLVLEASSFQLETVSTFRAHVAVWLNFSPNHLDRYPGVDEYREAKLRIFERQTSNDFAVVNASDFLPPLTANVLTFSSWLDRADFTLNANQICFRGRPILDPSRTRLRGNHNIENLMAALAIGHALHIDFEKLVNAALDYSPPPHRCEVVRELNGVIWVNDSKATTLDAMEKALSACAGPIVLIAGGKDKGFEFDPIASLIAERVSHAVLIGEMRERIATSWNRTSSTCVDSLEEAVATASKLASAGTTVLFSPGTSSFDMFTSYVDRGNRFKSLVNELK
jgi:UDP-N-acetylmuramoylalanine--D-glutamate ligase